MGIGATVRWAYKSKSRHAILAMQSTVKIERGWVTQVGVYQACTHWYKSTLIPLPISTYGRILGFLSNLVDPVASVGVSWLTNDKWRDDSGNETSCGVALGVKQKYAAEFAESNFFLLGFQNSFPPDSCFGIHIQFDLSPSLYLIVYWCCFLCSMWAQIRWACRWTNRSTCMPNSLAAICSLIKANI